MTLHHSDVPALHKRLRDVKHKYAVALVYDARTGLLQGSRFEPL